jgi:excisionase family DNA binding protein
MTAVHNAKQATAVSEFCSRYGICRDTFYAEVRRGRLRATKVGKKTLILRADEDKWLAALPALELPAA